MMPTVIVGASHQGRVVLDALQAQGGFDVIGFLDDDVTKHGSALDGKPVLGDVEWALRCTLRDLAAIVAIGDNPARVTVANRLRAARVRLANAVHPSAVIMTHTTMGSGNLICAATVVAVGTRLEDDVVINTGSTIDHDCLLCRGAQVASGVHTAGGVTIGQQAFVGIGSSLGPNVTIGDGCIVGAGSVVLSDLPPHVLAFGTPARVVRELTGPVDWRHVLARK